MRAASGAREKENFFEDSLYILVILKCLSFIFTKHLFTSVELFWNRDEKKLSERGWNGEMIKRHIHSN